MRKFLNITIEDMDITLHLSHFHTLAHMKQSVMYDHLNYEAIYVPSGEMKYATNNKIYTVSGNSILLMPPGTLRQYDSVENAVMVFVFLFSISKNSMPSTGLYKKYKRILSKGLSEPISLNAEIRELDELRKYFNENSKSLSVLPDFSEYLISSYMTIIMAKIFSQLALKTEPETSLINNKETSPEKLSPYTVEISDYINSTYNKNPSIKALSEKLHLSVRHTERLIKKDMGTTFLGLLNRHRIKVSKHLIKISVSKDAKTSYTDIASSVGYSNYYTFLKHFKLYTGMSPSEYKNLKHD